MDLLLVQLPELVFIIVEELDEVNAHSFSQVCRDADNIVNYKFKIRSAGTVNSSYRGWNQINKEDPSFRWYKFFNEAKCIQQSLFLAWSFHNYTNDACQRAIDSSENKFHGSRVLTTITDGQFGKALHFGPSSVEKGSQLLSILTSNNCVIKQFTLSFWIYIQSSDNTPIISFLFGQGSVVSSKPSMAYAMLSMDAQGRLFFGRSSTSTHALLPHTWHHLVLTSNAQCMRIDVWDHTRAQGDYAEILRSTQPAPRFDRVVLMVGKSTKSDFIVEEMSIVREELRKECFGWLRNGLPFLERV